MKKEKNKLNFFERLFLNLFLKKLKNNKMVNVILAKILDKFKVASPTGFLLFSAFIIGLYTLAGSPEFTAILLDICAPCAAWLPKAVQVLAFVAGLLGGVHTTKTLVDNGDQKAIQRMK